MVAIGLLSCLNEQERCRRTHVSHGLPGPGRKHFFLIALQLEHAVRFLIINAPGPLGVGVEMQ